MASSRSADTEYLVRHRVPQLMNELIVDLVHAKPSLPQQFMSQWLMQKASKPCAAILTATNTAGAPQSVVQGLPVLQHQCQ